jgi:hypothetical protein
MADEAACVMCCTVMKENCCLCRQLIPFWHQQKQSAGAKPVCHQLCKDCHGPEQHAPSMQQFSIDQSKVSDEYPICVIASNPQSRPSGSSRQTDGVRAVSGLGLALVLK